MEKGGEGEEKGRRNEERRGWGEREMRGEKREIERRGKGEEKGIRDGERRRGEEKGR